MSAFFLGIITGVLGAAVWELLTNGSRWWAERRGAVAGNWLQVTYGPDDHTRSDIIWSIEFLELRHYKIKMHGTMWRLYPTDYAKRWTFEGRYEHAVVLGVYAADRDVRGGFGLLLMRFVQSWMYVGEFFETVVKPTRVGFEVTRNSQPMEWVNIASCNRTVVDKIMSRYLGNAQEYLPCRVRRALGIERAYWFARINQGLIGASAATSPQLLLETARARRDTEGLRDLKRSDLVMAAGPPPGHDADKGSTPE
jgi:hypothetical protein